jgi:glutamate-ammonia-ligase adenylyltransferase
MGSTNLPTELRALADTRLARYHEQAADRPVTWAELPGDAERVWSCSDFVAESCIRHPALLADLIDSGDLERGYEPHALADKCAAALDGVSDEGDLSMRLRRLRRREMVRIAWRDLGGLAGLEPTVGDTSALADALIDQALSHLHGWLCERFGVPHCPDGTAQMLVVFALGKLGAEELNFSSDIDLIFAYPEKGETRDGKRRLENHEYFIRLAQQLIRVLGKTTEDGIVYRVDMRLRPFGASGPLVDSFAALEDYYQIHGRDWERYAWIRARPVAGDVAAGEQLIERLRPFVFRRYFDFGALEALRDMKRLISDEVARRGLQDNIKLGPGGIREIEFVAQAFQLVRGGQQPELRDRRLTRVLGKLRELDILPEHAARELRDAYGFLRASEHRLQQVNDQQVHTLPTAPLARTVLATGMGCPDWERYAAKLATHRSRVQAHFDQVFGSGEEIAAGSRAGLNALWAGALEQEQALETLGAIGFDAPERALAQVDKLRDGSSVRLLGTRARQRLQKLMPVLLEAVATRGDPTVTLERVLQVVAMVASRSVYLALLLERPLALSQLVRLCGASVMITRQIARHPVLLDELLDPRTLYAPLDGPALALDLEDRLARVDAGDVEREMDALREFKQTNSLRIAAADINGALSTGAVSTGLTRIAETALGETLKLAWRDLVKRYSKTPPAKADLEPKAFVIVAYGKLGGSELGYGSDLDLVFLHGDLGASGVTLSVDDGVFFARLGQRIIHYLNTRTPAGHLYEIDARLRPSGASGLLVSSIDSFEDYQLNDAWTWEHQALVRARHIVGSAELAQRFGEIRQRVLLKTRDPATLCREVREMRERMRSELGSGGKGRFDLKQDPGGIADIEFIVQYVVLRWAAQLHEHLEYTDTEHLLDAFQEAALMPAEETELLEAAYATYREQTHARALQEQPSVVDDEQLRDVREAVLGLWERYMQGEEFAG